MLQTKYYKTGMVHMWVGQKLVNSNILQVLFDVTKFQLKSYFT
jgi:hypothetical protein